MANNKIPWSLCRSSNSSGECTFNLPFPTKQGWEQSEVCQSRNCALVSGVSILCIEKHTDSIRIKSLARILVLTELLTCVQVFMALFAEEKATVSLWSSETGNKKKKNKHKYFLVMPVLVIWAITGDKCVLQLGRCFWAWIF